MKLLNQLQKYQRSTRDLETEIQEAEARYAHVQSVLQKCENDLARALPSTHPSATLSTLVDKVTTTLAVLFNHFVFRQRRRDAQFHPF